ncbi:MAG: DNA-3-methyladenine glycosylase I [Longimicrobiales bacterium]
MLTVSDNGVVTGEDGIARCWWCVGDALYQTYHDREWGRPVSDDRRLFEKLCLEGFMSGLSWLTILKKRENFRRAFDGFDIESVARLNTKSVDRLMKDDGIVRNRAKIEATINNARRCLELIKEAGSFAAYAWSFEPDVASRPKTLDWPTLQKLGTNAEATTMSKDLKKRGWAFVGPTTVYSFMEAMGLVNDHVSACALRAEVVQERAVREAVEYCFRRSG